MIINNNDIVINGTTISSEDLEAVSTVSGDIQAQLDAKAPQSTTYTKTEINNKPTGFKNLIINGGFDVYE